MNCTLDLLVFQMKGKHNYYRDDIQASDKFSIHVHLWICRPVGESLQALTNLMPGDNRQI